jgi:hypothetical protein
VRRRVRLAALEAATLRDAGRGRGLTSSSASEREECAQRLTRDVCCVEKESFSSAMLQDSLQRWTAGRPQLRRLTDTETGEQRTPRRAVRQASAVNAQWASLASCSASARGQQAVAASTGRHEFAGDADPVEMKPHGGHVLGTQRSTSYTYIHCTHTYTHAPRAHHLKTHRAWWGSERPWHGMGESRGRQAVSLRRTGPAMEHADWADPPTVRLTRAALRAGTGPRIYTVLYREGLNRRHPAAS